MLRVIRFEPTDAHRRYFNIAWQGMLTGGITPQGTAAGYTGRKAIKQARRIKDALRAVSVAPEREPDKRSLSDAGGVCALAEEDFARLLGVLDAVAWIGSAIDDADETFEFLDASEKKSPSEVAKLLDAVGTT